MEGKSIFEPEHVLNNEMLTDSYDLHRSETVLKGFQNKNTALGKLSAELNQKIFEDVEDFPIGMEEAKEVRSRLMEERGRYVVHQGEHFEKNTFFLCEH
jgi:hypothetical protein